MKKRIVAFIICLLIPPGGGALVGFLTGNDSFSILEKPPLTPPQIAFPIAWGILYVLMGIASFLVLVSSARAVDKRKALTLYIVQLLFNFAWSIFFFSLDWLLFSFIWLVLLFILACITTVRFWKINKAAGLCMLPYLAWLGFAGYLNLGFWFLNR